MLKGMMHVMLVTGPKYPGVHRIKSLVAAQLIHGHLRHRPDGSIQKLGAGESST